MSQLLVAQRALTVPGWAKDALWRRAQAIPSLDLRFADSKSLVDATTGSNLVTFTRASSGTFVDSAGVLQTAVTNEPRFDHNPTTGESLGLLVEEQRTNLLPRSEEFDNAFWTKTNATITTDTIASPAGPVTADKLVETSATGVHRVFNNTLSILASTTYTLSVYAKAGERSRLQLDMRDSIGIISAATFNLVNGNFTSNTGTAHTITALQNGWYRLAVSATTSVSHASAGTFVFAMSDGTSTSYTGDGTSGIYLWGAQLEAASTPSSYIPTTTAAVTRSASVADVINQAIANNIRTLYLEFRSPASGTRGVASLNDNTANERASVLTSGTDPRLVVVDGGVEQANVNGGTVTANQRTRIAVRINANDFAISINGGAVVTDTSGTLPTVDRLMLGRTQAGEYLNGPLARVTGWTQLLPDSTMQSLTQ